MVDKLRKIAAWIWLNKERMVLFVMVGFLVYRVYEVVYPPPPEPGIVTRPPKSNLDMASAQQEGLVPPPPPPRPALDVPEDYTSLYRRNPFQYGTGGGGTGEGADAEELDIQLLNIQEGPTGWRAQLRRGSARSWFMEGEPFEEYVLEEIDPEAKTVTLYAERLERRVTLELEGGSS